MSKKKQKKINKNKKLRYYHPTKRDIKKYIPKKIERSPDDKKQKESPTDSPTKNDSPIEEEVDKLQEPSGILLKWYDLHSVKADQPPVSNNKIEKERKKTSDHVFKIIVLGKPEKTAFIRMALTGFFEEDIR
ncbi:unnamed protein product, partial [marine sediment metagenome]